MSEIIAPFKSHRWQEEPWKYTGPVMLLTGSAGGGKSRLAAEKVHGYLKKYPGAMGLVLRKMRQSMTNSTVLFMDRLIIGKDPQVRHYPSKLRFEYTNGSVLAYGGMSNEEQREQIRSIGTVGGVDIAWMEEANRFVENDFNEVLARMRGTAASWMQLILSTNPDIPTHWIYKRMIQAGEAKVFYSSALDNPANPAAYLDNLQLLTGVLYKRLVKGQWIQAEGAVYDYNAEVHLTDPFTIPADWRRIRVVDFGYTNPFVCQWWAIDNDGRAYLYREIYHTQRLVEDHARDIVELSQGEYIEATVCDHDAEDRATLARHGVPTIAANKPISRGIQTMQARLRKAGDGRARLFLMRDSLVKTDSALETAHKPLCTEDEFPAYIYPEGKDGRPVKEMPVDLNNHGMDAARYLVMYLDGSGPPAGETVDIEPSDYRTERRSLLWRDR